MADRIHIRERLEEEKTLLMKELSGLGRKDPTVPNIWNPQSGEEDIAPDADKNVAADRIEELVSNTAIVSDLEMRLKNVNDALMRLEQGTYGICIVHNEPIEEDRLEANPAATTCKEHRNLSEI